MLNGLSLFSGIGGIDRALSEWVKPICYCEIDRYAQAVLLSRFENGDLPAAPIWSDITTLDGKQFQGYVDIVYGGSPCQGLSQAGLRKGLADERSELFYEQLRLARETKATWFFWENVGRSSKADLYAASRAISNAGYCARAGSLEAAHVGKTHKRRRIWVLANAACDNVVEPITKETQRSVEAKAKWGQKAIRPYQPDPFKEREAAANRVYRTAHGIPEAVDRIKCLGNAVVPQCAREAFMRLSGMERQL